MSKAKKLISMFEMANYWPKDTGLPVVVWVEERCNDGTDTQQHSIKAMPNKGKMNINIATVIGEDTLFMTKAKGRE